MQNNTTNFNTPTIAPNDGNFTNYLAYLQDKLQEASPRRWWMVRRFTDQFQGQQFDMLFFRDLEDSFKNKNPEDDRRQMLIPLYQWLEFIGVNGDNSDNLLASFLTDNCSTLDVHCYPATALYVVASNPKRQAFTTDEISLESFIHDDLVPIYMVNKRGEMERPDREENPINVELYFKLEHIEFFELVFRAYSLLVENNQFENPNLLPIWQQYLTLMQENATAENLEEIHRGYWFSHCPEFANLGNTIKGVN